MTAADPPPPDAPARVVLLTRVGCHLCDDAREVVRDVCGRLGTRWDERDVDADPADRATFGEEVPVVLVDGHRHAWWRVDPRELEHALTSRRRGALRWLRR